MSRYARVLALLLLMMTVALSAGCADGTSGKTTFTFAADGSFTQQVAFRDATLDDDAKTRLESAGWKVGRGGGLNVERAFASPEEYSAAAGTLYATLAEVYADSAGYEPQVSGGVTVRRTVKDFLLFARHDVEIASPALDLAPTECLECVGLGSVDCPDCTDGTEACPSCNGTGVRDGWWGPSECWRCDGTGTEECDRCSGQTAVRCRECDGTGDVPEWMAEEFESALGASDLAVAIEMPGMLLVSDTEGEPSWKLEGYEIEDPGELTASSIVVNWLYAGIAAAVVLAALVIVVWLIVRRAGRALARRKAAGPPVTLPPLQAQAVEPADSGAGSAFCSACGSPVADDARFCRGCGRPMERGGA